MRKAIHATIRCEAYSVDDYHGAWFGSYWYQISGGIIIETEKKVTFFTIINCVVWLLCAF